MINNKIIITNKFINYYLDILILIIGLTNYSELQLLESIKKLTNIKSTVKIIPSSIMLVIYNIKKLFINKQI